jgi:DNA transformation protein
MAASGPRSLRVTDAFRAFALDQLAELGDVTPRSMFGGVGLYYEGVFFGILARDQLYFKTDDRNRRDYTRARMPAFQPYLDRPERSTSYFAVPLSVLESPEELTVWARKAIAAAARMKR